MTKFFRKNVFQKQNVIFIQNIRFLFEKHFKYFFQNIFIHRKKCYSTDSKDQENALGLSPSSWESCQ